MKEDAADTLIEAALKEDMPQGDITSEALSLQILNQKQ